MPTSNSQSSALEADAERSGFVSTGLRVTMALRAPTHTTPAPRAPAPHPAAAAPHPAAAHAAAPHAAAPPAAAPHAAAPHAAAPHPAAPHPAAPPAQHTAAPHAPAPSPAAHATSGGGPTLVSGSELRAIMTQLPSAKAERYLAPLNAAMHEFLINVRLRKAAFLAQVAHESGELAWFHEFASGMEYDLSRNPRKARELGNIHPGDGPRYKGRGPIQLTGRNNYRACGKALGLDLEGNPDMAVDPRVAFRTAGWFWSTHGLNLLADKQDFRQITRRINGGYTHYADRVKYYERALHVFPAGHA
jgi:putative chitinase